MNSLQADILQDQRIIKLLNKFPDFCNHYLDNMNISRNINTFKTIKPQHIKSINKDITDTIITSIPSNGLVISTSGTYKFGNNINWTPNGPIPAIQIIANNVKLDLNKYTLNCTTNNFETIGILATNVYDISIKNGKISNMGLIGIKINECINIKVKKIIIDGLTTDDIISIPLKIPIGIYFNICINPKCSKCIVQNINVHVGTMAAIQFSLCINSKLHYCTVQNLINRDGACTGIGHALCIDSDTKNCNIKNLQSFFNGNLNTQGHTCIGFIPIISVGLKFINCNVYNVKGCCDDAHGMSMFIVSDVYLHNCKISNITDGLGDSTGAKATGIELYAYDVKVSDCHVKNIKAIVPQDLQAAGFSSVGENIEFVHCKAENVSVSDSNSNYDIDLGFGVGFGWAPDPRPAFAYIPAKNVKYKKCTAKNCQVGFDTWNHINSLWTYITSKHNAISLLNNKSNQRTLTCNACSECDPPISTTLTNQSTNNKFIHVTIIV